MSPSPKYRVLSCWSTLLLITLGFLTQEATYSQELEFKTERVVVFKDGYGLFAKRARGTTDAEGRLFCDEVPDEAILGSVWADAQNARLKRIRSKWVETQTAGEQTRDCRTIGELLQANINGLVEITLTDDSTLSGKITALIGEPGEETLSSRGGNTASPSASSSSRIETRSNPTHVVLLGNSGHVVLPIAQVKLLRSESLKTQLTTPIRDQERKKQFIFEFDAANREVEILLAYFRPGIRWIPTYRIELQQSDRINAAQIRLQAEFLNEAEDLKQVPIDIVVGVPNFRFRETPSPLTLEANLKNTLQQAAPALMNQFSNSASNGLFSQRAGEFRGNRLQDEAEGGQLVIPAELSTLGSQDLFVYHLDPMTLDSRERAAVDLFEAEVPYRHLYTWDARVKRYEQDASPTQSRAASPLQLSENQVWHQIELTNNTEVPWTTGAALLMDGTQPLSQELLTYTSIGKAVRVPVTVAVDLRGSLDEVEVERQFNQLQWQGSSYAKITKRATLRLANNKPTPVDFEINAHLGGQATTASQDGELRVLPFDPQDWENYRGSPAVNNHSIVTWTRSLKPGETFVAEVEYHFYIRQ